METVLSHREKLYKETAGHCIYCGQPVKKENFEIDHIIPRAQGGKNEYDNKICCCTACNRAKADLMPSEYIGAMGEKKRERFINRVNSLVPSRLEASKRDLLLSDVGAKSVKKELHFGIGPYWVNISVLMKLKK